MGKLEVTTVTGSQVNSLSCVYVCNHGLYYMTCTIRLASLLHTWVYVISVSPPCVCSFEMLASSCHLSTLISWFSGFRAQVGLNCLLLQTLYVGGCVWVGGNKQ